MTTRDKLRQLCFSWGGSLKELSLEDFKAYNLRYAAPFNPRSLGLNWETKEVLYTGDVKDSDVIHEMAHVFASTKLPWMTNDYDLFGWEYCVAKHVGLPIRTWLKDNEDYGVISEGLMAESEIGNLTSREICRMLHHRVRASRKLGIVRNGKPLAVR